MPRFSAVRLKRPPPGVPGVGLMALALMALAPPVGAHGAAGHAATGWSVDPWIGTLMLASLLVQLVGWWRLGRARAAVAPPWRIACYAAAMAVLVLALFSPLDARADRSFAWHMLQHLLLMLVAAPLLAQSNLHFVALFALPPRWRRGVGAVTTSVPGVRRSGRDARGPWWAALAFAAGLWLWHAPAMYEAALHDRLVHAVEHLVFLVTAAVFWRMVATAGNRRLDLGSAILLVTLTGLQGNLMAALITLAPRPLYASYAAGAGLHDQQIAGLLMWVPAGLVYLASTVIALRRLIGGPGRARAAPRARHAPPTG